MDLGLENVTASLNKLAKLPKAYRYAIMGAIPVLVLGIAWQFFYSPARGELQRLEGKQQNLQRKLNEVRSVAANLEAFEEELDNLERQLKVAVRQLPSKKELPGLLTDITSVGKDSGLELKTFTPKAERRRGFYAEVPIALEFAGSFRDVAVFFDRIAKLPRIVNISKISMSIASENVTGTTLKVAGTATTFRFVEGGGA